MKQFGFSDNCPKWYQYARCLPVTISINIHLSWKMGFYWVKCQKIMLLMPQKKTSMFGQSLWINGKKKLQWKIRTSCGHQYQITNTFQVKFWCYACWLYQFGNTKDLLGCGLTLFRLYECWIDSYRFDPIENESTRVKNIWPYDENLNKYVFVICLFFWKAFHFIKPMKLLKKTIKHVCAEI